MRFDARGAAFPLYASVGLRAADGGDAAVTARDSSGFQFVVDA